MPARINIRLVDGNREPLQRAKDEILVTLRDGHQTNLVRRFFPGPRVPIEAPVHKSPRDLNVVLASLKGRRDAGVMPVEPKNDGETLDVHLMLVPREPTFQFASFDAIRQSHARLHELLSKSLDESEPAAHYETLQTDFKPELACLFNIVEALDHITLSHDPERRGSLAAYLDQIDIRTRPGEVLNPDRVFAWAHKGIIDALTGSTDVFTIAPHILHRNATKSFKQKAFNEANVQVTLHENDKGSPGGVDLVKVELDIDYFRDSLSHLLLEVTPNSLKKLVFGRESAQSLTDPALAYVLRWTAGKRAGASRDFAPAFVLA